MAMSTPAEHSKTSNSLPFLQSSGARTLKPTTLFNVEASPMVSVRTRSTFKTPSPDISSPNPYLARRKLSDEQIHSLRPAQPERNFLPHQLLPK
jgi:hypothetical protein